ncbi:hypothetical protein NSA18_02730 [Pasteurella caecimuris]|uniref:hypothetical protein n=1 Tax=Rodentibacter caecimuris TaxID=1796644 RepID=UPI002150380B|nr:hypothetical protein [Pasteurella caecimuris]MCR1836828.1 hypothetical protein [Pasteurella caecimuris]MCU0105957.1 hypothetical protein [Pasteurella caecimuris]
MTTFRMRTEQEMMQELALIAVREHDHFINDGSQYTFPNEHGQPFVYNTEFLDIRFIEDGRKDSVVKFTSALFPFSLPFYCLLSELNNE